MQVSVVSFFGSKVYTRGWDRPTCRGAHLDGDDASFGDGAHADLYEGVGDVGDLRLAQVPMCGWQTPGLRDWHDNNYHNCGLSESAH